MLIIFFVTFLIGMVSLYFYNQYQFRKTELAYPPKGDFVEVDGIKLHFLSKGNGKPVVFLHGGVLSSEDFSDVIELAAEVGYKAIAFDRPGYGHSERPSNEKVTPITQAKLIHNALKKLNITEPIILVGHSWSGTMVMSYALQFPKDVEGLVTLGGAMYKEGYPAEHGDTLSELVTTPILGDLIMNTLLATPLGKSMGKETTKATFLPETPPAGYEEKLLALWGRPTQFKANREDTLAFPLTSMQISPRYKEIEVPTVIVVGENDPFGTIKMAERLKKDLPNSKMVILPNVGHMIPENHPEKVLEAIEQLAKMK
ncbi:alpha/beta fold hydrolase [Niallia sp. MER TA 168]|jgi:pimeloyl-ACP methyl ester carboxylesterase|uniref:alpha/beta fold hydrolase n=1 Tax=Niallia sp. MER TA 168 TaxID=2939568 RepID=UPI00203E0A75|nr:alpha/beta hydrolase [Niallia sp. MER TA 168]MCM3364026.1 alpha/beta hydrolase [Niallia sp. MER TA 168]